MNYSPQQQQLITPCTENSDEDANVYDYLQVLDAGEHMYGMFVADDDDLYAYLSNDNFRGENDDCNNSDEPSSSSTLSASSSLMINSIEDIEDVITRSIDCCASFADMHLRGKGGEGSASNDDNCSDNDSAMTE